MKHDAGDADGVVEGFGDVDRVLAGQRVGDEENLVRLGRVPDLDHLRHQRLVDMGAAGGVEDDDVVAAEAGGVAGAARDLDRRLAGDDRQRVDAGLLAQNLELLLRRRAADVERGHQHFQLLAVGKTAGDLRRRRRLARALQADQHQRHRRRCVEIDRLRRRTQHLDQLVVDDLDDHLAGRDRADHVLADGAGAHLVGERAHHVERHVRLDQRAADLAHRLVDVGLRQRAALRQLVEDAAQAFG